MNEKARRTARTLGLIAMFTAGASSTMAGCGQATATSEDRGAGDCPLAPCAVCGICTALG